jgi:hypothetical protein
MPDFDDLKLMADSWMAYKQAEANAVQARREVEDKLLQALQIGALEGTETIKHDGFIIKMVGRIDKKVDTAKLQELAAEAGLSDHLGSLFRWKPEINATAWKQADNSITTPLLGAITSTPGRTSFSITFKE